MKYPLPFCNTNNIINCPMSVHTQVGWALERAQTKREWSKLILLFRNNLPLGCHYQQNETSYYLNFFCTNFRILVHCASVDTYLCTQQPCMKFVWHSRSKEQLAVVQQQQRKQCHHHQPPSSSRGRFGGGLVGHRCYTKQYTSYYSSIVLGILHRRRRLLLTLAALVLVLQASAAAHYTIIVVLLLLLALTTL